MCQSEGPPLSIRHPKILLVYLALVTLLLSSSADAWQEGAVVRIDSVDSSNFPMVVVNLIVSDAEGRTVSDISGLSLRENGIEVHDYSAEPLSLGSEIVFVIDANTSIEQRDEAEGLTRREKVRDSIARYANHFMDPVQRDAVSIVVPDGASGRYLGKQSMAFPNEVVNAVNFYETGPLDTTPLEAMMEMAFGELEGPSQAGRFRALFFFTDGGQIHEQLDLQALAERAEASGVAIYVAVLGARADPLEVENALLLTGASGGDYVHMRAPTDTDPLYELIRGRGTRSQITYRSQANESGRHSVEAEFEGGRDEAAFELTIEPPTARIAVDNSRPIRRVAESAEQPLEELEPQRQPLVAQIDWPDGHPRLLSSAALLVNDNEIPLESPVLDNAGLLTFDWDIRMLEAGAYDLRLRLTDELGLESLSEVLPLVIEIQRPELEATAAPPTAIPTPAPEASPATLQSRLPGGALALAAGSVALVAFMLAVAIGLFLVRRSRRGSRRPQAAQPPAGDEQPGASESLAVPPTLISADSPGAYLEALENAPEHAGPIPITGSNVAIGREKGWVQIAFQDSSVSDLHARIMSDHGIYRIVDEGSASGTYVNYERVGLSPRILNDTDDVHFGRVHLRFRLGSAPSEIGATMVIDSSETDEDFTADTDLYEPLE